MKFAKYVILTDRIFKGDKTDEDCWDILTKNDDYGLDTCGGNSNGLLSLQGVCKARTQNECKAIIKELKNETNKVFDCKSDDVFVGIGTLL